MNNNKPFANWPILGPIILLLNSPAFLLGVATLVGDIFVSLNPAFAEARAAAIAIVTLIGTLLISGQIKDLRFNLIPFITPFMGLVKSRKFLVSVMTLVVNMIVAGVPQFEAVRTELITVFTVIGSVLVGTIAWEDVNKTNNPSSAEEKPTSGSVDTVQIDAEKLAEQVLELVLKGLLERNAVVLPK